MWRWTRWRGWDIHGEELIIFVVRDLTDSLLCVFPCSNNRPLLMLVSRSMTSEYGVFIPFSNNLFFYLSTCFSRPKSPKGWSTWCKLFRLFFFLWCWYCVSFPWVSEVEIEIAVTKTNCMYTASSKVVYKKLPLLGLLLSLSKPLYDFVISLFSKFGCDCRSCVYCKVLFHYTVPVWKSTLLVIGMWNIIYRGP